MGAPVICRWRSVDPQLVLDVMPTDPDILGFSNPWYDEAISSAVTVTLESGAEIRAAAPPALVATKLCAWKGRGDGDLLPSLDIHDVLTLIDGRSELIEEVASAAPDLRTYIRDELSELRTEGYFDYAVESATASYGPVGAERARLVHARLDELFR
jgi:predicted nucleotidyltransferase